MASPRPRFAAAALAMLVVACGAQPEAHEAQVAPPATAPVEARRTVTAFAPASSASGASTTPFFAAARVALEDRAMGTHVLLATNTTPDLDEAAIRPKLRAAFDAIVRLETMMTTWRPDSEVSRINHEAGKRAVAVSRETLDVIEKSIWMSRASEGVFDITFEAMHGLWKFDEDLVESVPSRAAIDRARKLIDYRKIRVDDAARTVMLEQAGMRMSLGGIAKGYAIDAAAAVLEREGLTSYLAQAGGDLYVRGRKPDGSPWRVGVRDPRGSSERDFFAMLDVEDHAFSTAGDYERGFVKDGRRYHHIIDPRTGYPATACRSVTIWAKDAFTADAIDDAVFILGPEKGLALVESLEGAGAVIVDAKNKVWISKRLEGKVLLLRQPTDGV